METIKFPCKECDNDILLPLTDHPSIAECTECGHPNDTPSAVQIQHYDDLVHHK